MKKFNPKNNIFQNWNKDLYIATVNKISYDDYNNQIIEYNKPYYFGKVNYQPMNWREKVAIANAYGNIENEVYSLFIDYNQKDKFKEFDLAYINGVTPKNEKVNGSNANYIVKAFRPQNTKIMVILEEIIKDNTKEES